MQLKRLMRNCDSFGWGNSQRLKQQRRRNLWGFSCSWLSYSVIFLASLLASTSALALKKSLSVPAAAQALVLTKTARIGDQLVLKLAVASTPAEQALGLGFHTNLPADQGMLFPCQPDQVCSFWGKNTLIPLDLIFVGPDQRIVKIAGIQVHDTANIVRCQQPVQYAIELNAGLARKYRLKVGDLVELQ